MNKLTTNLLKMKNNLSSQNLKNLVLIFRNVNCFQIKGTNNSSTLSKKSMTENGYFEDNYIKYFAQKQNIRRSPLINIGYFVRATIMNYVLMYYMEKYRNTKLQILSLGAGFDTTYFKLASNYPNVIYFEIDYPEVVNIKSNCIHFYDELRNKLNNEIETKIGIQSLNYYLIAQDLNEISQVEVVLKNVRFDFNSPTIVFSECAITYMDESKSTNLINWFGKNLTNSVILVYEQVFPNDGFGLVMRKHFDSIQTPLKSVIVYRTPKKQQQRFFDNNWKYAESYIALDLYNSILDVDKRIATFKLEPFDEWEEWHLKCMHYTLCLAVNGNFIDCLKNIECIRWNCRVKPINWDTSLSGIARYSHESVQWNNKILIVGGFGPNPSRNITGHKRIPYITILKDSKLIYLDNNLNVMNLDVQYHAITVLQENEKEIHILLYGGRKSPLQTFNENPILIKVSAVDNNSYKVETECLTTMKKPETRWRHIFIKLDDICFLFGGRTCNLKIFGDLWSYDIKNNSWEEIVSSVDLKPQPRFSHSSTAISEDEFIIFGGLNSNLECLGDIWKYNIKKNCWAKIFEVDARYGSTVHFFQQKLYIIGGISYNIGITVVNFEDNIVQNYSFPSGDIENPIMVHNHATILSEEEESVIIVGGGGNCFSFGTSFNKNIVKILLRTIR